MQECSHGCNWQLLPPAPDPADMIPAPEGRYPAACRVCGKPGMLKYAGELPPPLAVCRFRGAAGRLLTCDTGEHLAMIYVNGG